MGSIVVPFRLTALVYDGYAADDTPRGKNASTPFIFVVARPNLRDGRSACWLSSI